MALNKSNRIVSAGTWITVQDMLAKSVWYIWFIGLAGSLAAAVALDPEAAGVVFVLTLALSGSMLGLSWGLEEFRMNGMPYEARVSERFGKSK